MSKPEPLLILIPILLIVAIAVAIWYFVFRNKCTEVDTPYYNKKSKKCEVCPTAKPTWNKIKKECQAAIAGTIKPAGTITYTTINDLMIGVGSDLDDDGEPDGAYSAVEEKCNNSDACKAITCMNENTCYLKTTKNSYGADNWTTYVKNN